MPLRIHFLNVGRGDCTIIEFPSGRVGVVDVCNLRKLDPDTEADYIGMLEATSAYYELLSEGYAPEAVKAAYINRIVENLTDPLEYYDKHIGKWKGIFRLIITHPDMDHMSGLYRLHCQDNKEIVNFWHLGKYDFNLADADWDGSPYDKVDWETYKKLRISDSSPKNITNLRGDQGQYWTDDNIEILSPTEGLIETSLKAEASNVASMVLKITHCDKSVILGGDATGDEVWPDIYETCDLGQVWIFKASHHGRKSGYHWQSVKKMNPYLTITSVPPCKHDATDSYRKYSSFTASLRDTGSFCIEIDDNGNLKVPAEVISKAKARKEARKTEEVTSQSTV